LLSEFQLVYYVATAHFGTSVLVLTGFGRAFVQSSSN
jgi:hypothetical protein